MLTTTVLLASLSQAQTPTEKSPAAEKKAPTDRSGAYYNFAMGHLYAELAGVYGNRGEYASKAIEHYKEALKLDPSATFLFEELTDLYIQSGKLNEAVSEADEMLRRDPEKINARKLLARIYTRMIGDTQQGKINSNMLQKAIEQYEKITAKDPGELDSWLALGRLYRASSNSVEAEKAYNHALEIDKDNEEALTGLALVYSDVGDTRKAIEKLQAVTARNSNPRLLAALANAYEQMRDYKRAAEVLQRATEQAPDNPRLMRALAQDLLFAGRYDESLKYYQQILEDDPKDAQAQLRIAQIYREKREFDKAKAALAKARELDPESVEVRYDEVNLLEAEGKTDQAIAGLKGILDETAKKSYSASERANRAMLLERLGILYQSANQFAPAADTFRQLAEFDPDSAPRASVRIVDTYRMAKDLPRAQQEANAALKKYPEDRAVKLAHAQVLADTGKVDEAAAEVRSLLNGERDRETQLTLAQIYDKGKRYKEMQAALDEAEKLSTSDSDKETVYFMRGALFEKLKKYDESEAEFRKVLKINPDNAGALNYLGYMLADRNIRLDEAQKLISRAVELEPQNGAYLDSLGWVCYRQNRLPEAENHLLRALERMGKDPTIHDHLGDVYFKQGKTKDAINQWQASLKEWENASESEMDPAEVAKINRKLESARVRLAQETSNK